MHSPLPASDLERSKDRISQTAYLRFQTCQGLIFSSNLSCVSWRTCGYRTRKPPLYLAEPRQGALLCNGFTSIQPDAAVWLAERRGARGVVLGTSQ
jgi:hypothetical protein